MINCDKTYDYNIQITLERHFENCTQNNPAVKEIHSLWILLKKQMEDELINSRSVFINYSLHDSSHSRSIIQAIERFLGEERILQLSATDTFMLLACAYAHDYGMSQTYDKIYDILGSPKFKTFLEDMKKDISSLENEDAWAVENLLNFLNKQKYHIELNDIYYSITLIVQLYLRPNHWKGVTDIRKNFEGLFLGQVKNRFINRLEGIVGICMCHGQSINELLKLPELADGMAGDNYHPRFVAAMLRLGDLLDLDNGRFPTWFIRQIAQSKKIIPKLSIQHFKKHEAISHLLITPKKIEVTAHCWSDEIDKADGKNAQEIEFETEKVQEECYEIAGLVNEWTQQLTNECRELVLYWDKIVQPNFGRPPAEVETTIYVDGKEYISESRTLQMKMSQERVMNLLEGTSIYRDRYVGIRELLQNAIDASLLQLWNDLNQNRYASYGLRKDNQSNLDLLDFADEKKASIFGNYDIKVEVMEDKLREQVYVIVKDKGIGITEEEVTYIADIGSSREKNSRVHKLLETMPAWLKPSGIFGIGLQSVFQLTDRLDFYTRQHNMPEREITLYSYGKSRGKIVARDLPENEGKLYYDNTIPGTNVKIAVKPEKLLGNSNNENNFEYYDTEFDTEGKMDLIFKEVSRACINIIEESPYDYFNIRFETKVISKNGTPEKDTENRRDHVRKSYIYSGDNNYYKNDSRINTAESFENICRNMKDGFYPYYSNNNDNYTAYLWSKETCRFYTMKIKPCNIDKSDDNLVSLPSKVPNVYKVNYKFNKISNVESIYAGYGKGYQQLHAGLFELELQILDDHPEKYMNIDRDRLRDGAINEKELIEVYQDILKRWCEYYINIKESGSNANTSIKREYLCSFLLLFYQNIPENMFRDFLEIYKNQIKNLQISLAPNTKIAFEELIKPGHKYTIPATFEKNSDILKEIFPNAGKEENIFLLPHHLIHIEKITGEKKANGKYELQYTLSLGLSDNTTSGIDMDDTARLYDYYMAFDMSETSTKHTICKSIIKKVFKPDRNYNALIVPCYPQTFQKGQNMKYGLDYCIKGYILSPFDKDTCEELEKIINKDKNERDRIELVNHILESRQYKKCVSYIINNTNCSEDKNSNAERIIKEQYEKFLRKFINLFTSNI